MESWLAEGAPKAPASWRGVAGGPGHFDRFGARVADLQQARLLLGTHWPTAVKDVANTAVRDQLFKDLQAVCLRLRRGTDQCTGRHGGSGPRGDAGQHRVRPGPPRTSVLPGWLLDTAGIEALASSGAQQPTSLEGEAILAVDDKDLFARVDPVNGEAIAAKLAVERARFEHVVTEAGHTLDGSTRDQTRCRLVAALANPEVARQLATQAAERATTGGARPTLVPPSGRRRGRPPRRGRRRDRPRLVCEPTDPGPADLLQAQRTEALRQRYQSNLDRMPRSRAMLGTVLIFVQLPLAVVALARLIVLPNLADYFSLTPAGMADFLSFLDSPVGVWLSYASQPWAILPVTAASLLLVIRSARTSTAASMPRPPIERRLMQVLIVLTTLLAPLIAPLVAWGFVHGLTRYAAHKYRSPLRSWGFFLSTSSLLFALLLALACRFRRRP